MNNLLDFAFREEYRRFARLGDRLAEVDHLIDWDAFRPIVDGMYDNTTVRGGRPSVDAVVMVKMLVLQAWHGLSDPELERQVTDRISFRNFLGFPASIPDRSTVWLFRERLAKAGKDREIWRELDRQLDARGLKVRKGVVQDATFITSDPGHARLAKPRGEGASELDCCHSRFVDRPGEREIKVELADGLYQSLSMPSSSLNLARCSWMTIPAPTATSFSNRPGCDILPLSLGSLLSTISLQSSLAKMTFATSPRSQLRRSSVASRLFLKSTGSPSLTAARCSLGGTLMTSSFG
jgi:hypothetical protein